VHACAAQAYIGAGADDANRSCSDAVQLGGHRDAGGAIGDYELGEAAIDAGCQTSSNSDPHAQTQIGVRAGAAANPQLGTEALLRLAGDSDASVRRAAAGNRHLPTETLGTLAADADEGVRARVAGNPATPASQLLMLAEQRSAAVDLSLAGNRSVPTEVLFRLADRSEPHSGITRMVARNPGCPEELRRRLSAVQGPLPSIPRTIKQAKRARRKNWLAGIAMILGMVGGGSVAWCLALWEAARHPEDPGIAMLGLHSFALKKKALDLAADGEPDASALAEIRQMAGQRTRTARRVGC
jgi:hypothetical protein